MQNTKRYDKKLLEDYDLIMKAFPNIETLRKLLAREIGEGKRVLEIGPGPGDSTQPILDAVDQIDLTLIDTQCDTTQYIQTKPGHKVQFVKGDATKVIKEIPKESYDIFTASWTIHNFDRKTRTELLRDAYKILKKGGLFLIMDKCLPINKEERSVLLRHHFTMYDYLADMGKGRLRKDMIEHEIQDLGEEYIIIEDQFTQDLKDKGFSDIQILDRKERDVVLVAKKDYQLLVPQSEREDQ